MGNLLQSGDFDTLRTSSDVSAAELRNAPRFTILIRAAKLIAGHGEFLCVIRDASDTGFSARIFHPLPKQADMIVELQNGERYAAEMVWQNEDRAGFRFARSIDVKTIIESSGRFAKRPVRLNVSFPAQIEANGRAEQVTILNISQQGAQVTGATSYAIDEQVKLCAAGMRDTQAKVRWRRGGACGLVFEETFQFGELARIVRSFQAEC